MEFIITEPADFARVGADQIAAVLRAKPAAAVAVATGNTPISIYQELAARRAAGTFDAGQLRAFQLDAYLGTPDDDPRSLFGWMRRAFLEPLHVPDAHVVRFPADPANPEQACRDVDRALAAAGGLDLAILGLGPNGHLGFNEPPVTPDAPTRQVTLTEASIQSNAAYWGDPARVPRAAFTLGMRALLSARQVLLLVSGAHKRAILRRTVAEPPTPDVPASYLQQAARVTVVADRAAWGE